MNLLLLRVLETGQDPHDVLVLLITGPSGTRFYWRDKDEGAEKITLPKSDRGESPLSLVHGLVHARAPFSLSCPHWQHSTSNMQILEGSQCFPLPPVSNFI